MHHTPVVVSLPIADRPTSFAFYRDGLVARARDAGAEVVTPPGRQPWGYAGAFADPDGHVWMVRSEGATRLTRCGHGGGRVLLGGPAGA